MSEHTIEKFGVRLDRLLREQSRSQAWLVAHSKLTSSVVSRLVRGDRLPTAEHVAAIAPLFGMSAAQMVADTNAESRVAEASQYVNRAHFESVHRQLVDAESEIELLKEQLSRLLDKHEQLARDAQGHERDLNAKIAEVEAQLHHSQGQQAAWQRKSKQSVAALCEAVTDLAVLSAKLAEIQTAAEEGDHARLQTALDGSAAIGKRTAVDYLEKYRERRHE